MSVERFEDLEVWKKAKDLAIVTYQLFRDNKDFRFCSQLQSAAVSISNNIAEGFERRSNNELRYFLFISKGSCGEYRSMLYIAKELEYINEGNFLQLYNKAVEVSKMLFGLINSIKK
ncbi:MAG: four helix bundle protein [Candidatus Gastranaerophilaceae bacterium]|jgi:four helix bundle protein